MNSLKKFIILDYFMIYQLFKINLQVRYPILVELCNFMKNFNNVFQLQHDYYLNLLLNYYYTFWSKYIIM